jgi:hypothetical protein
MANGKVVSYRIPLDYTTQRVKRHPLGTMAATFALGVLVGGIIDWVVSRG